MSNLENKVPLGKVYTDNTRGSGVFSYRREETAKTCRRKDRCRLSYYEWQPCHDKAKAI